MDSGISRYCRGMADTMTTDPLIPIDRFGVRLAVVRAELGLNVSKAAELCNVDPQSWTNWERGGGCRDMESVARKIADATHFDYRWLVAGGPLRSRCFIAPAASGQISFDDLAWGRRPHLTSV